MGGTGSLGSVTGLAPDSRYQVRDISPILVLGGVGSPNRADVRLLRWSLRKDLPEGRVNPHAYICMRGGQGHDSHLHSK